MLLEITTSGIESNPWPIVKLPELGAVAVTIENPASLLTDAPLKDTEPSVIPAAEVVEYPTSSTLKVLE